MVATFVVVPQWQGSGSSRAMRLVDGADAIKGDLPASSTRVIDVPLEAGDSEGSGVSRLSSIAIVRDRLARELADIDGVAITIGGDCGVELAAIPHVAGDDVAVVWFDAHPDLNTPETSPSRAFGGMTLRALLGEGAAPLIPATPLLPERVVLVGARSFDPGEDEYLESHGVASLGPTGFSAESLLAAVEATGASTVYVHIDLDVIDPGEFSGAGDPQPFGLETSALLAAMRALLQRFPLVGAGVTGFAPASPADAVDDMPTILRIIGALSAGA
jgi:arginase